MSVSTEVLCGAVAAELRMIARLVESLAETLLADEQFLLRHLSALQGFDLVTQCASESATLLDRVAGGDCPKAAIAEVRLEEIQARLRRAVGDGA